LIKRRRFPRVFFGWWTVLAGGILSLWGQGYYLIGMSALFKPIASELGFSRAVTSIAASIGRLEGGVEAPLTGWITDKFGPRWIITFGVFLVGLGLILMYFIDSLWAYFVVWGVIAGTGNNIALTLPLDKAITNWFVKKRGLALGIRWAFTILAAVIVLPLIAWLITTQGWRTTCLIGGVVMLLVGLPVAWFLVKQYRPEYYGLLPDGAKTEAELKEGESRMIDKGIEYAGEVEEVEFTLRQAMRTASFWLLILAQASHSMAIPAILLHRMPFLTDMGIDPVKAALIIGVISSASIPAFIVGGFFTDRIKRGHLRFLMGGAYFLQSVGIAAFLLDQTIAMVYVFFILYYIALGISLPLTSAIFGRYFGRKGYGSIRGSLMMFIMPVGVASPIYCGWVYDTTGSYIPAFTVFTVLLAFSALIMALARPPKPPARVTDIRNIV